MKFSSYSLNVRLTVLLVFIFAATAVPGIFIVRNHMIRQALAQAENEARIILNNRHATTAFYTKDLAPPLFDFIKTHGLTGDYFELPWMYGGYANRKITDYVKKNGFTAFNYKNAAVNARVPANEANGYERAFLERSNRENRLEEWSGTVDIDGRPYYVLMVPNKKRLNESCMRCHSTPDRAPKELVDRYGTERGFNKVQGTIPSVFSLRIPLSAAYENVYEMTGKLGLGLLGILIFSFALQWFLTNRIIVLPVKRLSKKVRDISNDADLLGKPIPLASGREIKELSRNFNRLSKQLSDHQTDQNAVIAQKTAALRKSDKKFRSILNSSRDTVYQVDVASKRFDYITPSSFDTCGYTPEEIYELGADFMLSLIHPDDWDHFSRQMKIVLAGKTGANRFPRLEYRINHKTRGYIWVNDTRSVLFRQDEGRALKVVGTIRDISDQKQAREEIQNHSANLDAIFNNVPNILLLVDETGNVININHKGIIFSGKPRAELAGAYCGDVLQCCNGSHGYGCGKNPECAQCPVMLRIKNTFDTGKAHDEEPGQMTFIKNGDEVVLDLLISTCLLRVNGTQRVLVSLTDISTLKSAEEAANHSKSMLEAALESTADGVLIVDNNRRWMGYNKQFLDIWGIPAAIADKGDDNEATAYVMRNLKSPDIFLKRVKGLYDNIDASSFDIIELNDGRILERYSKPHEMGERIIGRVWSIRDVTLQRLAASELKESEEYHKGLFEYSPIPLYIQDFSRVGNYVDTLVKKGITNLEDYLTVNPGEVDSLISRVDIVQGNQAAVTMYRAGSSADFTSGFAKLIKPGDIRHIIDQIVCFTRGEDWYEGEARNLDFKGNTRNVILRKAVINRKKNGLSKILVSVVDVTALYRSTMEKQNLERRLQQTQKMETIGTLAGGIAHDFNNILFPISGHAEILLTDVGEDDPARESINEIYTGAMRAKELVNQILTFSRQESTEMKLMKIQHIIKEALKLIRSTIPTTIEIKQHVRNECAPITADPTQIHQIVMNLATNAYHAMEETGGILSVALSEADIRDKEDLLWEMMPGSYVCLTVGDTGVGMTDDLIDKIFDPFFTTKEKGKGTGMGLSVVHGIVTGMGGGIKVESTPGQGTRFTIYFPAEKKICEDGMVKPVLPVKGGDEHILLVDDEKTILDMEKQVLKRLGYTVSTRTSSLEALEAFRASPSRYDLVISDVAMPHMRGDRLAVKMMEIRPDIPVLLCTGFSQIVTEEKALEIGVRGLLMKPLVMKDLAETIRKVMD
ncbi:MAG: DUF3365 domain-containing protein [Desulfobacterales bacterium]|nr:DUF3365 domain-containing protein [Desulfobacterales bacterium]